VISQRGPKNRVDPTRPYAFLREQEHSENGDIVDVTTIFLTNRECPWHCAMCDLWKNTTDTTFPRGAIPKQIDFALSQLPSASQIKLYNSGSFFDRAAIPPNDWPEIAERLHAFERVIVESHPSLIGPQILRFHELLTGKLEVAMGLETADPETLARLNKGITVEDFVKAAEFLREHGIALRTFLLIKPPFQAGEEAAKWSRRSVEISFNCGSTVVSLIPTRLGNGALDTLAREGQFVPPKLSLVEKCFDEALGLKKGRVFVDLWDLEQFSDCPDCFPARKTRLGQMNLRQEILPRVNCTHCG